MFTWLKEIKEAFCPPSDLVLLERHIKEAQDSYYQNEADKEYAEAQLSYLTTKIERLKLRRTVMKEKKDD